MEHHEMSQDVLKRLARIEGHTRAVVRMYREGQDCAAVLQQIAAVQKAWDKVAKIILEDHVKSCIMKALDDGTGERALTDLKDALARFLR